MSEHIVVLRTHDPVSFLADACAALAQAVNEVRAARPMDSELVDVYAEAVGAYARLMRGRMQDDSTANTRVRRVEHLLVRLDEARAGIVRLPVLEIVDRLHGELASEGAPA